MGFAQLIIELKDKVSKPIEKLSSNFDSMKKRADKVAQAIAKANTPLRKMKFPKSVNTGLASMDRNLKRINRIIVGGFIGRTIASWGSAVLNTTVDFEKFEKRLKNVFGGENQAKQYLSQITDFAVKAKLPLDQVTESFVDLAQRGNALDPSQMQRLGDFAVFTATDIGQLSDAIGSVSDPDKWKAFGVDVAVSGKKMKATFQGMTVEVQNSQSGAINMINAFGRLNEVQGASSKQTQEVGRGLVGLSNKFQALQQNIGEKFKPLILGTINVLSSLIDTIGGVVNWVSESSESIKFWSKVIFVATSAIVGFVAAMNASFIVVTIITAITTPLVILKNVLIAVRTATLLFNAAFMANPIGFLIGVVVSLIATFLSLKTVFPKVYDSIVDWFGKAWDWVNDMFIKPVLSAFRKIGEFFGIISEKKIDPIEVKSIESLKETTKRLEGLDFGDKTKGLAFAQTVSNNTKTKTENKRNAVQESITTNKKAGRLSQALPNKNNVNNTVIKVNKLVENIIFNYSSPTNERAKDVELEMKKALQQAVNNVNHAT